MLDLWLVWVMDRGAVDWIRAGSAEAKQPALRRASNPGPTAGRPGTELGDSQRAELDRHWAVYHADPSTAFSEEEFRDRIRVARGR